MNIRHARDLIIRPVLKHLGRKYGSKEAENMLLIIGETESGFSLRKRLPYTQVQIGQGAAGLWQFELDGGCAEFEFSEKLTHFRRIAAELRYPTVREETHQAIMAGADILACIMARAILWLEPEPLPDFKDVDEMYRQYLSIWQPGKPNRERFNLAYLTITDLFPKGKKLRTLYSL